MFTDNPSYFSLSSGGTSSSSSSSSAQATGAVAFSPPSKPGFTALFRRRPCKTATGEGGVKGSGGSEERCTAPRSNPPCNGPQGGLCANQRRSFRSLFRSVSANADPERTQQFLKGDPRPSDVAPPSPYLPHRSVYNSLSPFVRTIFEKKSIDIRQPFVSIHLFSFVRTIFEKKLIDI